MLFNAIRIILWLIISVCVVLIIRKSNISRKKFVSALFVVLCTVIISVSGLFPIENLFVNYKSPDSVFYYANFGKVDEVIYGRDSCLIVYTRGNDKFGHHIIPKTVGGYKIPDLLSVKKVSHKFDENGLFDIYNVKNTRDYYVFGTVNMDENVDKINVYNENGEKVDSNIVRVGDTHFFYFFLYDLTDGYYLSINNEKVFIK